MELLESIESQVINASPFEVFWLSANGDLVYANDKCCESLGYNHYEINKLSIYDINPTVTKESWKNHWLEMESNGSLQFKAVHRRKSGAYYDVEIYVHHHRNKGDTFLNVIALDASHSSFYHRISQYTEKLLQVGGWKLNLQDKSVLATDYMKEMFHAERNQDIHPALLGVEFLEEEEFRKNHLQLLREGKSIDMELTTKTQPKKYFRAIAQAITKGDKIYKIHGAYQDITAEKLKEQNLLLIESIVNSATDLIYLYNRAGKLLFYNNAVQQALGFSRQELDGFTIFDLDAGITTEWWNSHFNEIIDKGVLSFEWHVRRKDGTKFPAEIKANHLSIDGEDLNCAIIRDSTERNKRDLELRKALLEIQELKKNLEQENQYLQDEIKSRKNFGNIICKSDSYAKVLHQVSLVAPTDATVLVTGESGTGKELIATAIHEESKRKEKAIIKINCANLPKDLIESELFGHKKGAFTGAVEDKVGKFLLADGGSLFLDEIGEIPIDVQPKLLRVLQDEEFSALGDNKTHKVDVRIIAATNRDLEKMVGSGTFREDLFYRLNVFPIENIPLRERKEDIPPLAEFFLERYSKKSGKHFTKIAKKTIDALMKYDFPGNIRELEHLIERAIILEQGPTLNPGDWLPKHNKNLPLAGFVSFEENQRNYILQALEHTKWRISGPKGAATLLKMNDKTLYAKMKRLGIEKK